MKKYLLQTSLVALLLGTTPMMAQTMTDDQWNSVRSFLEENPEIMTQLDSIMNQPSLEEQAEQDLQAIQANQDALYNNPDTPVLGNPDGDIILVKFSDYACPHCKTMNDTLASMMEKNPRIQVRLMEFPILGEQSVTAAKFALAVKKLAGDEAYHLAHDALFAAGRNMSARVMTNIAVQAGVSMEDVTKTMEDPAIIETLEQNLKLAQSLKITGTPGIVFNAGIIRGSVPEDQITELLNTFYTEEQTTPEPAIEE